MECQNAQSGFLKKRMIRDYCQQTIKVSMDGFKRLGNFIHNCFDYSNWINK